MTPAGQRWTRNKPTEPGSYWLRREGYDPEVLTLYYRSWNRLTVNCQGDDDLANYDGEWYGPIQPPKDEAT